MNRQQHQRDLTGIILQILLTFSVIILIFIVFRFFLLSQSVPETEGLGVAITSIYPYKPQIDLPIDTESKLQAFVDSFNEQASLLDSEYLFFTNQVTKLKSLTTSLMYLQFLLLFVLLTSLVMGISQNRKHDILVKDYRNLRNQYQKLLGSKKIVDAELEAAREYITELEHRMQGK
jgi:hypothetical protein